MDIQEQIQQIENQVQIAEAGYQAFRRMYAQTNRPPQRKPYVSRIGMVRTALIIIMVASSAVSASHTIPTFAGENAQGISVVIGVLVGIAAFFMSEVALATFAYVGVQRHYRDTEQEPNSLKKLIFMGVLVPFVVMGAANLNHVFTTNGVVIPQEIRTVILLAISLSAPFMGYISGEVFAMYEVIDRVDEAKHESIQSDMQERWEEKCRAAWGKNKSDYGGKIKVEPVPVQVLSARTSEADGQRTDTDGRMHGYGSGYTKRPDARDAIRTHLTEHPEDITLSVRELADKLGRPKTTVGEVLKEMRA
jgi:uncharacterized membrane protein YphA (DoxX/SURF4 family)